MNKVLNQYEFLSEFKEKIEAPYDYNHNKGIHREWVNYIVNHVHLLSNEALEYFIGDENDMHNWSDCVIEAARTELSDRLDKIMGLYKETE